MKSSDLFKKVKQAGWQEVSQAGSHIKMKHPVIEGTLIFPYHGAKESPQRDGKSNQETGRDLVPGVKTYLSKLINAENEKNRFYY